MFAFTENKTLAIGDSIPCVTAPDHNDNDFNFKETLSDTISIVFFYPKAHTPGCTMQACSMRDVFTMLHEKGIIVLGVSSDSPKSQKSFKEKHSLPYTLISDKNGAVAEAFGKSKWSRQAYIFNENKLIWKDTKGVTSKQGEEAIAALSSFGLI
ncbi:peroxiredoxin [Opitutae bacterium]|nr:peroxiredoxin [Opitutae bacterium]